MTADEFKAATGYEPKDDDLDRANCDRAGDGGHWGCGICEHGKPVFTCQPCFSARGRQVAEAKRS
jgi:hypothetical protein